jgi:methylmalonyl-CoA/ethylmalonyl-CoA epimerase
MTNDELRALNKKRKIHQIAWVTRDLEKSMRAWVDNLQVGPWTVLTFTEKTLKYLDVDAKRVTEPFKFLIGISWIGEIQVELIQPVYGPMIYEAFLQKHGEGLHHIKERISQDDIDEVLKEYQEKGIEVTQTGQFKEDFHYYLNTEPKLDFVLELGNCPLLNLPKDEFPIYPPDSGDQANAKDSWRNNVKKRSPIVLVLVSDSLRSDPKYRPGPRAECIDLSRHPRITVLGRHATKEGCAKETSLV